MGQKVQPIGFRTGIRLPWMSTWFAPKANYGEMLIEDHHIREYVDKKFNRQPPYSAVAKVTIERTRNDVKITLHTARPGMVIGPRGSEVDKLREELEILIDRKVNVNVIEIKEAALNARLTGDAIAEQIKKRASFRRTMKQQCEFAIQAGARGVKIICSGRLGGAEMARKETQKLGSIPLQTLDADVDYASVTAITTYGCIGIKVWIYKGKYGEALLPGSQRPARRTRGRNTRKDSRPVAQTGAAKRGAPARGGSKAAGTVATGKPSQTTPAPVDTKPTKLADNAEVESTEQS